MKGGGGSLLGACSLIKSAVSLLLHAVADPTNQSIEILGLRLSNLMKKRNSKLVLFFKQLLRRGALGEYKIRPALFLLHSV